jgi:diacylglycerol kinase (ATP)
MKHLVFIVNPNSGVERKKEIENTLQASLDRSVYSYEILHTEYAGHGEILAANAAAAGAFAVVAVGGDGSVNDVIRGLKGSGTAVGIIPQGSGNGMARTLDIPVNVTASVRLINRGKTERIDLGYVNDRLFVSNAGVGYDALIAGKFAGSKRRGLLVYSWLVTKYLWLYRSRQWQLEIDGQKLTRKAFMINVANGQQFGYDFKIAPDASWTDGLLDVIIIKNFPRILGSLMAWRMMRGTLLQSRYVERIRGKHIVISHPSLELLQTDGDPHPCSNELHFRVEEKTQLVIV